MKKVDRRNFIKSSALAMAPAIIPVSMMSSSEAMAREDQVAYPFVRFSGDGRFYEPAEYLNELQQIHLTMPIKGDNYGHGGAVEALEKKFAELTGKEKAIYMPTGTLANQLAISVLSGDNTKVYVQETSHVYRDEADAAQSVFNKRLMPLAKDETYFTAAQLQEAIEELSTTEVFQSGVGAVSVENPVRRKFGGTVPLEEIKKISMYCKSHSIKLHLDGARLYLASAWQGVSVMEYSSWFDTVYISLYKYLGASGGAILCGNASVIDKMPHLIKIHGGNMASNWTNAAMALHKLERIEQRFADTVKQSSEVVNGLNRIIGIAVTGIDQGTNIFNLSLQKEIDGNKMRDRLYNEFKIMVRPPDENNKIMLMMNETILYQNTAYILNAFSKSIS